MEVVLLGVDPLLVVLDILAIHFYQIRRCTAITVKNLRIYQPKQFQQHVRVQHQKKIVQNKVMDMHVLH